MKGMEDIIEPAYRVPEKHEGNNLILEEDANLSKPGTLYKIRLNVKDAEDVCVYKFDQKDVIVGRQKYETYAPFLREGGARSMCDFIVFYRQVRNNLPLHAWVVNLKSNRAGNNLQQMRAGQSLCKFLYAKLNELLKAQDTPQNLEQGEINYVLFTSPKTQGTTNRPGTNPLIRRHLNQISKTTPDGMSPENCITITTGAYILRPVVVQAA